MNDFFIHIYDWFKRRKWLAIVILSIVIAACVYSILHLHYKEDIADFLPKEQQYEKFTSVYQQIGGNGKIVIIFSSQSRQNIQDSIVAAIDTFGTCLKSSTGDKMIKDLQLHVNEDAILDVMQFMSENYPYFLTDADYARMDSLLATKDYIPAQLENNKQLLMLPTGDMLSDDISHDPLHLFTPVLQRLQSFKVSDEYTVYDGCLFTQNGNKGLVFMNSAFGISESENNQKLSLLLDSIISSTQKSFPNIKISAVGAPLIAVTNSQQIKNDSLLAISISIILIFLLLFISFRRFSDLGWIGLSLIIGWIIALGCMSAFKDDISMIVLGIGSVIIGIAVNYPLHFLDHLKHEHDKRKALREMVSPLLIGNITTVSAFLSLAWLNSKAMSDLGIFGSLVLVATILFVLIFLPIFVKTRKTNNTGKDVLFGKITSYSFERKKSLLIPVILITAILGWFSMGTSFDANMQHINYMTQQQRSDLSMLNGSLSKKNNKQLFAVCENTDLDKALQQNETLQKETQVLLNQGIISSISGIGSFIPSQQRQKQLIDKWNSFWNDNRHAAALTELHKECTRHGFADDAFSPFFNLIHTDYTVKPSSFFQPIIDNMGNSYITKNDSIIRIINYIQSPAKKTAAAKSALNSKMGKSGFVFDNDDIGFNLVNILSSDFNYVGYVCGFIVFFFLWISFGRLELSLLSFLPLAVSWIWILGIMQLGGIQFNIVNIILATFIFGQGDDYTIFITEGLMYEYAYGRKMLSSYKSSVALSATIMFVGIGTLIIAKHPALRSLAEVTMIGMFTVVMMAYYLPSLIFRWITVHHGIPRDIPLTLSRLTRSLFSMSVFLVTMFLFVLPFTYVYHLIGRKSVTKRNLHILIYKMSRFILYHIPGIKVKYQNCCNENFEKPSVVICNHQSHLDLLCLLMLSPKLLFITNEWVWHNPFYGYLIQNMDYLPASRGLDALIPDIRKRMAEGYSIVIFPEGTRSADCSIMRFHRGAFYLAEQLRTDVVTVFLHGAGHVLPKKDFMLRKGTISIEIGRRIGNSDTSFGEGYRERTSRIHRYYTEHYAAMRTQYETVDYYSDYIRLKYLYKGRDIESRCKKTLRKMDVIHQCIGSDFSTIRTVNIINSGQGEIAWLMALVHHDIEVHAYESDNDKHLIASHCTDTPKNLHFHLSTGNELTDCPIDNNCKWMIINPDTEDQERYGNRNIEYIKI
jgi:1-acyl-sn-glycerol-3-phosphate acyltransferase